tara:strand:+ start:1132 stop:1305 length:174 start_codon:yes stop_codon:yes gene_type:complete
MNCDLLSKNRTISIVVFMNKIKVNKSHKDVKTNIWKVLNTWNKIMFIDIEARITKVK